MAEAKWQSPKEWSEWAAWLAAGLDGRCRWRLGLLVMGVLFARGRRTVSTWIRAAGLSDDFVAYYYFLATLGRKAKLIASHLVVLLLRTLPLPDRLLFVLDDTPTKRYGPKVEGADIHHNPTRGPADQKYLYGHIWVTLALATRHPRWGAIGLPLRAMLYVRQRTLASIPRCRGWTFHTKLELAAKLVEWIAPLAKNAGKTVCIAADGFYAKRPFLKPAIAAGAVVVSRLRKDAALYDLPPQPKKGGRRGRGRPPKYGKNRLSLAKRAAAKGGWQTIESVQYGQSVTKTYKTFLATYRPAGGVIGVVLVKEEHGWHPFFSTDPNSSVREILETFADRATIEQDFHDVKEVWGAGQQQVRNIWTNVGVYHVNLWMHTLVELWAWSRSHAALTDRSESPWDNASRRPSHADRRNSLREHILRHEFSIVTAHRRLPRKILDFTKRLLKLAA